MYGPGVSTGGTVSTAELWLIRLLWFHAALSVLFIVMAWRDGIVEDADLRFVVNTTAKDGLFAVVSVLAATDARRRLPLTALLIVAYCLLVVGELFELVFSDPGTVHTLPSDTGPTTYLLVWMIGDLVFIALFGFLYRAVSRAR